MRRDPGWIAAAALLLVLGIGVALGAGVECTCTTTRATNGWCPVHAFGYVGGVKVTSRWLYEAADAHGHQVDTSTFSCERCKDAIATNGFCSAHRIGFVNKLAYFSRLTYELAKGEIRPVRSIACATCRKNSESFGWCARSKVGMVGEVAIRNRDDFDQAVEALRIFIVANATAARCDRCAVAIITDTECPLHGIKYKDGKLEARAH